MEPIQGVEEKLPEILNKAKMPFLCRLCLTKKPGDSLPIFEDDCILSLPDRIMLCTNLTIYHIEGLPNDICSTCYDNLTTADHFRLKCLNSDKVLRKKYPEYFLYENKLNVKDLKVVNCKNEIKNTKEVENSNSLIEEPLLEKNLNLESILKNKQNSKSTIIDNVARDEIKEEKNNISDVDIFNDDFSCHSVADDLEDVKPLQKKKKSKKKHKNSSHDVINIENHVDIVVKEEMDVTFTENEPESVVETQSDVAVNEDKMYICGECGKPLSKRSTLLRHIQNMHSNEKKSISATSSRKTGHGKDKRFHCPSCPYVTKFSQSLVYHERIHTGERPHKCPHCSRTFSQPGSLTCHLKTHSDKTYFTCAACGRQFKHKDSYEVHKLVHSENRELFTCEICNTSLKSRKTLESHMNRHNNIKNYSCEMCGLRFVTLVELINHSKKHNTEKIYKCNFCDFRTALKRSLQSHTKRHSNYRPFKCQSCDLSCFTKWELRNHEKTHTRESNYTCFVCQRKFIHSSSVNKHMQRTHGVKYQRNDNVDRRKVK